MNNIEKSSNEIDTKSIKNRNIFLQFLWLVKIGNLIFTLYLEDIYFLTFLDTVGKFIQLKILN